MAGKIIADTLEHSTAGSIATNYVVEGSAKVWLSLTMTTATNNDSLNVGSVTDVSAGKFDINMSAAFANSNYAIMSGAADNQASNLDFGEITGVVSTSTFRHTHRENNANADTQYGSFSSAFGDLA